MEENFPGHSNSMMRVSGLKASQRFGKRHILSLWLFTGIVNLYILRVSVNVAIVSMVNDTARLTNDLHINGTCPVVEIEAESDEAKKTGEFHWDHQTRGVILSAFYYGYICTQFIGGFLARKIGGRLLFGLGVGVTALLTLVNPPAARIGPEVLTAVRVVEGLFEGVTFPACYHLFGNWAPNTERTVLVMLPLTGAHIGTVISGPLTGWLCDYGFAGGWPSAFYVFGAVGLLWCIGWFLVVHESPAQHPSISADEQIYIEQTCAHSSDNIHPTLSDVPWKAIATSKPVWALTIAHVCFNWGFYYLLTKMATYLRDVLHISTLRNGIVSSIPYVCFFVVAITSALISDVVRAKGANTTIVRKVAYCTGATLSAAFLVVISYIGCDIIAVVTILCLAVGISGMTQAGFSANHVDLAPQYASILIALTNTLATLPGIVTPLITGAIINKHSTIDTWQTVFVLASGVSVFGAIIFCIFGEDELQPWAKDNTTESVANQQPAIIAPVDVEVGEMDSYL